MKNKLVPKLHLFTLAMILMAASSCSPSATDKDKAETTDTVMTDPVDTTAAVNNNNNLDQGDELTKDTKQKTELSTVLIYNFHVTNRCVSCIAIEDATTETINAYFSTELKEGRIKRYILNVDDDVNRKIAEKYQAFGSGLFVTRVFKGKETTTDLTGDGFKYAKNKEEKFIEILKTKITEYLK